MVGRMVSGKHRTKSSSRPAASPRADAHAGQLPPTISGRWLVGALAITLPAALLCTWAAFCALFWQGSWQLLYHPSATVVRTPSSAGLSYIPVGLAPSDAGTPQLSGWWIPAGPTARCTALFLHGQDGNMGDALGDLVRLHNAGANVLAIDYRGYGASEFARPTEARWREDAESALGYLAATRHIAPHSTIVVGAGLGANLALEVAAAHSELAGVVLESPLDAPASVIFNDPRARLIPAHLLVHDRWELLAPAAALSIPSLWFLPQPASGQNPAPGVDAAFQKVSGFKTRVWLSSASALQQDAASALSRWLDSLH
jgi:alpha/beta superfamily hydrolase